jgi:hypothetical protein
MEGDLDEFINILLSNKSVEKKTIELEFSSININELFDNLLYIFTKLSKKYINDNGKVNIDKLKESDIYEIKSYFASFGINLLLNIYNIEYYKNYKNFIEAEEKILEDTDEKNNLINLMYKIIFNNKVLLIRFDYL